MMSRMKFGIVVIALFLSSFRVFANDQADCTLEPKAGKKAAELSKDVMARMSWDYCNSIVKDLMFEWPAANGIPDDNRQILRRAAELVSEWERKTNEDTSVGPGKLAVALENRSKEKEEENGILTIDIPVSGPVDKSFAGFDGAYVEISSSSKTTILKVQYWANP